MIIRVINEIAPNLTFPIQKTLDILTIFTLTLGLASAGDSYSKAPVLQGLIVTPPPLCPCFDPGAELSLFGSGLLSGRDDDLGGGAGIG